MHAEHLQIGHVARRSQVCIIVHAAAHQDALPLRHTRDLPRGRPPVPLRPGAALAPAWYCERRIAFSTECADIVDLEDRAVLQRGSDKCVLEVEREARQREGERDDVRG